MKLPGHLSDLVRGRGRCPMLGLWDPTGRSHTGSWRRLSASDAARKARVTAVRTGQAPAGPGAEGWTQRFRPGRRGSRRPALLLPVLWAVRPPRGGRRAPAPSGRQNSPSRSPQRGDTPEVGSLASGGPRGLGTLIFGRAGTGLELAFLEAPGLGDGSVSMTPSWALALPDFSVPLLV